MASSMVRTVAPSSLYYQAKEFPLFGPTSALDRNVGDLDLFPLKLTINRPRNASILPLIRAQSSPDYFPDAKFYKIEAILRPWRIPQVSSALLKMGIRGVTVSDVRGFGAQGGLTERQAGSEFSEDKFLAKVKMEIVVSKDQVEAVIEKIIEEARTGEIGDGKIFLVPVSDVIRVRTGERGEKAERMMGGRADMSSAVQN
ncbi:hypothetical protein NMG60_11035154 [Bertholletia excelsa]